MSCLLLLKNNSPRLKRLTNTTPSFGFRPVKYCIRILD